MELPKTADVVVVGGGVVGVAVGLTLAQAGLRTVLLEKGSLGGAVTAASLACIGTHMMSVEELPLLKQACALWRQAAEAIGGFEYRPGGQLRFVEREADLPVAQRWVEAERAAGCDVWLLEAAEVRRVEPALTGPILAATWSPADVTVNPFLAVRRLAVRGREAGLAIVQGAEAKAIVRARSGAVVGVVTPVGTVAAPNVVLAAGPWAARIAGEAGIHLPIRPRQAQAIATTRQPPTLRTVIGACEAAGGVEAGYTQIQQAESGQILFNTVVGGQTAQAGAEDQPAHPSPSFIHDSVVTLLRLFPSLASVTLLRSWARFEAITPDGRFLVGPWPAAPGLYVGAGCNGTGFIRALLIGEILRDGILEQPLDPLAALYAPARFLALPGAA